MKNIVFAATALFATIGAAQAQSQLASPSPVRFLVGMGVSAGGDDLATATYTNGHSQDIKAGGGVYFTGGVNYRVNQEFSIQGTANFHIDSTTARNGSITFRRFPVELMGYYHLNDAWRVGAGVRYVSSPKLSSSGAADGIDFEFDNTTSGVVEVEYFWIPRVGMKMRYVKETFKAPGIREVKGNHFGISGNFYF
jgi:opacity protein-like surface antigen